MQKGGDKIQPLFRLDKGRYAENTALITGGAQRLSALFVFYVRSTRDHFAQIRSFVLKQAVGIYPKGFYELRYKSAVRVQRSKVPHTRSQRAPPRMSFLKYFGGKSSKKAAKSEQQQQQRPEVDGDDGQPNLQNARENAARMSISKSGRYKQKERRRSSLFENSILAIPEEVRTSAGQPEVISSSQLLYNSGNEQQRLDLDNGNEPRPMGNKNVVDNAGRRRNDQLVVVS